MTQVSVGDRCYCLTADERDGGWVACARCGPSGDVFGVRCQGATEREAVGRLVQWLGWQRDHTIALAALQEAARAYHRTIAGSAFTVHGEDEAHVDRQAALDTLDAARRRLDHVRANQPRTSSREVLADRIREPP